MSFTGGDRDANLFWTPVSRQLHQIVVLLIDTVEQYFGLCCAGTYAPAPTERVHSVLAWLQQAVIERIHAGGCKAPPPVQSVIQGVLSDCMNSFEQCKCVEPSFLCP